MKKRLFVENAMLLTVTSLLLRVAGMFFRIYIANKVGDEGMGLYQLIFSLYNFGITLATTGVSVASTRMVAEWLARDGGNPRQLAGRVVRYSLLVGGAAGVLLYVSAEPACTMLLQDERAILAVRILAPSLPCMAVGAALRGCFSACRNVRSSSGSQIFEQIVRIALVAYLLPRFLPYGVSIACAVIVVGNTVSEFLSAFYMAISWKRYVAKMGSKPAKALEHPLRDYAAMSAPVTATRGIGSLLVTAENMIVPACLASWFGERAAALSAFGQLKGMAMPVLFFPFSFLATISTLLLPEITEAHAKNDTKGLERLVRSTMLVTSLVSVLMGGLFTIFSAELGQALYHSEEIGFYLRVIGPLAPLMYLESMVDGILRGLGEQIATFRYSVCDSCLRIAGTLLLVPRFGMAGFLFVMLYSNLFTSVLNLLRMLRVTGMRYDWSLWAIKPCISLAAGFIAYRFVLLPLVGAAMGLVVRLIAGMLTVGICYLLFLWLTGCISKEKLEAFRPKAKR